MLPAVAHSDPGLSANVPVDIVYSWVDGTEPEFAALREKWRRQMGVEDPQIASLRRFDDNCELKLSLRSIEKFAPWINNIYILVANQKPKWLDTSHPKIHLVDLGDIYPNKEWLPVFNSHALEFQLHHIPNLSEHFLYSCDDMLLGQPCTKEDFFLFDPSGDLAKTKPRLSLTSYNIPYYLFRNPTRYRMAWCNLRGVLEKEFPGKRISYILNHHMMPMCKSSMAETAAAYPQLYAQVSASRFRSPKDIPPIGFTTYRRLLQDKAILADISACMCHNMGVFMSHIQDRPDKLLCINDQHGLGDICERIRGTGFLETSSSFEKSE